MAGVRKGPEQVAVGVLATLTMDAAFLLCARLGGERFASDKIGLELIGRWAAGVARGRFRPRDVALEQRVRGEAAAGLAVHYVTGVTLTVVLYRLAQLRGRAPGVLDGAVFGAATALLPQLVMYPSWGLGVFARRSDEAWRLASLMLLGHTAFGAAIGLWADVLGGGRTRERAAT